MTLFLFEARRLCRKRSFVAVFSVFMAIGFEEAVLDKAELSWAMLGLPLLVTWVTAFDLAGDLRGGRLDPVLSRGARLSRLLTVRFFLALAVGVATTIILTIPAAVVGAVQWRETFDVVLRLAYWAAVGVLLGLVASGGEVMLLGVLTTCVVIWWGLAGCFFLTGRSPAEAPWSAVTLSSHVLGSFLPLLLPLRSSQHTTPFLELFRLPVAVLWLSLAWGWAERRNIRVRDEG